MGDDDAKRIVLLRRARFVAAALAGATAATACDTDPKPCLSLAVDGGTPPNPPPQPCLTPPFDGGFDAGQDAGDAADAADADADADEGG